MRLSKPRVLVADEYPDAASSLADLLTLLGFEAEVARTPLDAIRLAGTLSPHAVVMELRWGGTDGDALAVAVRRAAGGRPTMVAVVGHHGEEGRARAAGFDHCFLKPADPTGLALLLARATAQPD